MSQRIRELDGIRGIAVLAVFVWHYFTCLKPADVPQGTLLDYLLKSTYWCWAGVDLFFVLSGFLIGGIILDKHGDRSFLKVFWIRRACRILPALMLLLAVCLLCFNVLDRARYSWLFTDFMPWWSYPTFTQNIFMGFAGTDGARFLSVTWTLAIEEQFYLVAPLLIFIVGRKIWVRSILPLMLVAVFLRFNFPGFQASVNTLFRMDSLLFGVLVAAVVRNEDAWASLQRFRRTVFTILLIMVPLTGWLLFADALGPLKYSWVALVFAVFILWALLYKGSTWTFPLRAKWLCFFGALSYGLYLYHVAILGLLHGWIRHGQVPSWDGQEAALVTCLAAVLSIAAAWASFRFVESRFLAWAHHFEYGKKVGSAARG